MLNKFALILSGCFLALALMLFSTGAAAVGNVIQASADGEAVWTVYGFGNTQAIADTFRALANFTSSSTFQSIVGMIAVLGVISVGISSGFSSAAARTFIGYIVAVYLVCYVFFGVGNDGPLVVNVEVVDTVDATWRAPVTVPAVVGIPAALISTAGYEITRQIEASFPLPDEMRMSNGAPFNLASSLISDASQAKISDPNLANSLAYYVQDCFVPAVARGELSAATLTTSTDFINDIRWDSPSVMVMTSLGGTATSGSSSSTYTAGEQNLVTCNVAWSLINTNINNSSVGAASFLQNASAWAKTPALNVVNSAADQVAQWATNNGITDGGALVKQSAVLASFSGAFKQAAAATGNSDFLTGLNIAQAQQQQTNGWIMGAEVFNRMMGYIYAILQVFIYAATPLILAAALVPGLGFSLLKNFGQLLLWMALWQPMLAIVNFIVLSMQQADIGGALASGTGEYGFTLTNMGIISQKTANMRAAAMFIGTMVPALTWGLVKGSVDFSRFISEAAGDRMAQSAAMSMTTGNYSLNQASMDSFTANKHSLGATGDWGSKIASAGLGAIDNGQSSGGSLDLSGKQAQNVNNSNTTGANDGGSISSGAGNSIGGSKATAAGNLDALANSGGRGKTANESETSTQSTLAGANLGVSGHPLGTGGGPGGGGDGGGPGEGGGRVAPAQADGAFKKIADGARNALTAGANVALQGNHQEGTTVAKNAQTGATGTKTLSGGVTDTKTEGATITNNASTTQGYTNSQNMGVTGVASLQDRVAVLDAYRQSSLSRMGNHDEGPALFTANRASPSNVSRAGQMAEEIKAPDAIANKVDAAKGTVQLDKEKYSDEAEKRAAEAAAKSAQNKKLSDAERAAAAGSITQMQTEADKGALTQAGEVATQQAKAAAGGVRSLAERASAAAEGAYNSLKPEEDPNDKPTPGMPRHRGDY